MKTYDLSSRINHWSIAVMFVGMLIAGITLEYVDLSKPNYFTLLKYHKAVGVILLILGVWRVAHRVKQGFAEPVTKISDWQKSASKAIHMMLLISILFMPISGIIMAIYSGYPTDVFGFFTMPSLDKNEAVSGVARSAHKWAAYLLIATLVTHIGAALKHHFIDKDKTLSRMTFGN